MNAKTRKLITFVAVFNFCLLFVGYSASAQNDRLNVKAGEQTEARNNSSERSDDGSSRDLRGTWRVTVLPGTPNQFFSLMQFSHKGTLTEEASSPNHSSSIGAWAKTSGTGNYAAMFELFLDGNADGIFDGRFRVRQTIHVSDNGTFTGTSTVDVLTLDGTTVVAGPFGGIPISGSRMKVIPE